MDAAMAIAVRAAFHTSVAAAFLPELNWRFASMSICYGEAMGLHQFGAIRVSVSLEMAWGVAIIVYWTPDDVADSVSGWGIVAFVVSVRERLGVLHRGEPAGSPAGGWGQCAINFRVVRRSSGRKQRAQDWARG